MNARKYMVVANNRIITNDIESYEYDKEDAKYTITFKSGHKYQYNAFNVKWLKDPQIYDPSLYTISRNNTTFFNISAIYVFEDTDVKKRYWHICFENGIERDYVESELEITKSCLSDATSKNVFEYFKSIADFIGLKSIDGAKILSSQYCRLNDFINPNTPLASYLNPESYVCSSHSKSIPIFPFGSNRSQINAVKNALENQISIIQGPPGTGKTQTILNIVANLLITGKTVQIVSNNNYATTNILDKLSNEKYNMDFLIAPLGRAENKTIFLKNQSGLYPDLTAWACKDFDTVSFDAYIRNQLNKLEEIYQNQENLAIAQQELQHLNTEIKHFKKYVLETFDNFEKYTITLNKKITSEQLLKMWQETQHFFDTRNKLPFFLKLKYCFFYKIASWKFYKKSSSKITHLLQHLFYELKVKELTNKISQLEKDLSTSNSQSIVDDFTDLSMKYLKNYLYIKYGNKKERKIFEETDFRNNSLEIQREYPIILSTTFSSLNTFFKNSNGEIPFDYIIIDEASQVDLATGVLALSCAKNVVIVGDNQQLPNVVTDVDEKIADAIFDSFNISESYRFSKKSLLQSICELLPSAPQTILREHYRCHPKIIDFCNQKFYNNNLVIMTKNNNEDNVLSVIKTVIGNHERSHMNQRQIDSIKNEILPKIKYPLNEIGIITPYNNQVNALKSELSQPEIDIATVHKFQGREKDVIILTTVDDEVTEFVDNPHLLNVAISRAKKQLYLVVSGNEQPVDSNINDLISYIEYNNFNVTESKIYSVFDYLYKQYTQSRLALLNKYKKVSEYDSENLMFALIKEILCDLQLNYLDVIVHQPLNMLIRNPLLLNDEECRFAMNNSTHLDFLIYNRISKQPVLAIEVDGFYYHKSGTKQFQRDKMKNHILDLYGIPYLRFVTNESDERNKIILKLKMILDI